MTKPKKRRVTFAAIISLLLFPIIAFNAKALATGTLRGLSLCSSSLIPAIFPFMLASGIFCELGGASLVSMLLKKPCRVFFGIGGEGSAVLVTAMLCGFPIGAETALGIYKKGGLTREELSRLIMLTSNPSPAFIIGAVGDRMWGSAKLGVLLYMAMIVSAMLIGIASNLLFRVKNVSPQSNHHSICERKAVAVITDVTRRSAISMLNICAFVLVFSGTIGAIGSAVDRIGGSDFLKILVSGSLELTTAADAARCIGGVSGLVFTALFIGWSGLSAHMQVLSVCYENGVEICVMPYFLVKFVHGIVSAVLVFGVAGLTSVWAKNAIPTASLGTCSPLIFLLLAGLALLPNKKS